MLKSILLVEDNLLDQELALVALNRVNLGSEVFVVSDGAEAVDFLLRRGTYRLRAPGNPSVVLLDLKLPKLDGLEVLQAVRANEETARVPVVIVSGSSQEKDIEQSYAHGANAFVVQADRLWRTAARAGQRGIVLGHDQ